MPISPVTASVPATRHWTCRRSRVVPSAVMAMLSAVMVTTAVRGPARTDSRGTATSADPNPETDCANAARTAIPKAPSAISVTPDVGQRA